MFGSWLISSSVEIAFEARTPIVCPCACSASMAPLAARRMLRGVVLSLETSFSTARACFIRVSYSSFRFAFSGAFTSLFDWRFDSVRILAQDVRNGNGLVKKFSFPEHDAGLGWVN